MPRARQGQDRWHRPDWGAPERRASRGRRWSIPLLGIGLVAMAGWLWRHPEQLPAPVRERVVEMAAEVRAGPETPGATRLVYRWRNAAGVVQFTDTPPPEGVAYVQVYVDPATNALPAGTAPWPER